MNYEQMQRIKNMNFYEEVQPLWMKFALDELGVTEAMGEANNPRIVEYLRTCGFGKDSIPWCSAFANWCMQQSGYTGTNRAGAKTWLSWGKSLSSPQFGAITVFNRPPDPASGHVGFYVNSDDINIFVLGGNQKDKVWIEPYPKTQFLAYRWLAD